MSEKLYPFKRNGRFYFSKGQKPESLVFGTFPAFIHSLAKRKNGIPEAAHNWIALDTHSSESEEPVITWIGHSTFLIQVYGINILTDPIFGSASIFYPRMLQPGIEFNKLPPIHAVLISHNHRDHMDAPTLMALKQRGSSMRMLVPIGDKKWFDRRGFLHTTEFEWEQSAQVVSPTASKKITCTFVPADHWSRRGLFDQNKSLWGGWVIKAGDTVIYFAGDTAYSKPCFSRIAHMFPKLDVVLMPVGPGEPRSLMKHAHVDADEAGQAFLDLNARHFIPMHWGTFAFGDDYFEAPLDKLQKWWLFNKEKLTHKKLHLIKVGQRFVVPQDQPDIIVPVERPRQIQK